jgi:hypothetical protein
MSAAGFARFLIALGPPLHALAQELYERHRGNVDAAKREISMIGDHGAELDRLRKRVDAELAELRARVR